MQRMERVLVTGSTGFIGSSLVMSLFKKGRDFVCAVRESSDTALLDKLGVSYIKCNFNDQKSINSALKNTDTVVHTAGIVNTSDKSLLYESNVRLTERLVKAAQKNKIKRFILLSSAIVLMDTEEPYAASKSKGEEIVRRSGINHVILRPSLVYGENDARHIGELIKLIKKYPVIPVVSNGKYKLQPVYVGDIAGAIVSVLDKKTLKNKTYTLAGPFALEFNEAIDIISQGLDVRRIKMHVPAVIPRFLIKIYERVVRNPKVVEEQIKRITRDGIFDITPAVKDLNYHPISFREGILKTLE